MIHKTYISLCLLLSSITISAQAPTIHKWGDIPANDLKMTVYEADSGAKSVILQEIGKTQIISLGPKWAVGYTRWQRIKVFDVTAFDEGNLIISYRTGSGEEKLLDLDVQVISPDGKVEKVKSDNIFTEKISKYYKVKKVYIPNLQKGSIIEYRYELQSFNYGSLYPWYFQHDAPVRYSEYHVDIPTLFTYQFISNVSEFTLNESNTYDGFEGSSSYKRLLMKFGMANMPAMKEEAYVTTTDNYRANIKFQRRSYGSDPYSQEKYMTDWPTLAKNLEEDKEIGRQYLKKQNYSDIWDAFVAKHPNVEAKDAPETVLRFIQSTLKWDETYRFWVSGELNDAWRSKTGSSADLNLAVVALLTRLNVPARPALVSTRSHGNTFSLYPFIDQFNSLIAVYKSGDKWIPIDATDPSLAVNMLQKEHYNKDAWVLDAKQPEWILVSPPETSLNMLGKMNLDEEGKMVGHFTISTGGLYGAEWRNDLKDSKTEASFLKSHFGSINYESIYDSIVISDRENLGAPLKIDFNCQLSNTATVANNFIYLQPVLDFIIESNPFKTLTRLYPVQFSTPLRCNYVLNLTLPSGYSVEELPQPAKIALPENGGKIVFNCTKTSENQIQLQFKMNVQQTEFHPLEYDGLRKFFDLLEEKRNLQLVLKKT